MRSPRQRVTAVRFVDVDAFRTLLTRQLHPVAQRCRAARRHAVESRAIGLYKAECSVIQHLYGHTASCTLR